MRLLITDDVMNEVSFDTVVMTSTEFNAIHSHPYIASARFDAVVIDLNDKLNAEFIRPLITTTVVIPKVVGEITAHGVSILCEIYKHHAAELRIKFIRDKEAFNALVNELKEKYEWESFY